MVIVNYLPNMCKNSIILILRHAGCTTHTISTNKKKTIFLFIKFLTTAKKCKLKQNP